MTTAAARRLAKLEGALHPREAVLAWLAEAQGFTTIGEYGRRVAEVAVEAAPLSVILRRVRGAVRGDMKGQPANVIDEAVDRATRDAVFLFILVFQVNIDAVDMAKVEGLRATSVFYWMGCLLGGPRRADLPAEEVAQYDRELASAWATWHSVVDRLDLDLQAATQARATLSQRYYSGHDLLFADAATRWAGHVEFVERLKWFAANIAAGRSRGGRGARDRTRPVGSLKADVDERVDWLTGWSKVRAYELLGDRPKAVAIMERWLLRDPDQPSSFGDGRTL